MKANKMLGLVRRTTLKINDTSTRRSLHLQFVCSRLVYASQVWCPQSVELISDLEKIQRRAIKYILGLLFTTEAMCVTRLEKLDLLPISYWHEYLEVINGFVHVSKDANPVREICGRTRSSNNPSLINRIFNYSTIPIIRTRIIRSPR